MRLRPTNCVIHGRYVWLQDASKVDVDYVSYHVQFGGVHPTFKDNPNVEEVEYDQTIYQEDEGAADATDTR